MDNNGKKDKTIILWLFALLIAAVPGTFLATFIFDQVAPELLEKLFSVLSHRLLCCWQPSYSAK